MVETIKRESSEWKMLYRPLISAVRKKLIGPDDILFEDAGVPETRIDGDPEALWRWYRPRVLVIGTRDLGQDDAGVVRRIIAALGRNPNDPVVISGLAVGTDTVAHQAALDYGISTYSVLATGLDTIYPAANLRLAEKMRQRKDCGLISIYPDRTAPMALNFLRRTRAMVEMSDAVVIPATKIKGSSMVAAKLAYELGIPVYAVAGDPDNVRRAGCNWLIARGIAQILYDYKMLETIKV